MKRTDFTKQQLADTVKRLAGAGALKGLTVQMIADACGINRGTFYYHFYDKLELIQWIYHTEITEPTRRILAGDPQEWSAISVFGLDVMYRDKDFYVQALRLEGQNNLADYMKGEIEGNWDLLTKRYAELRYPGKSVRNMGFFAEFMANGAWAMLKKWVENGMQEPPAALADLIDTIAGNSMEAMAARYYEAKPRL